MANQVQTMTPFDERLSSIPMIPRPNQPGDGVTPPPPAVAAEEVAQAPQAPTLENAEPGTVFKAVDALVRSQDRLARNRWAIDQYHTWIDSGVSFGRLDKQPNQSIWVAKLPPGMGQENVAAIPNKANDLCNKVVETILSDPPKPNPQAHTSGEGEKEAGDIAGQFLRLNGGESGRNDVSHFRWALRNALPRSTSFLHYELDRDGGGYQPYQVLAHPNATDPATPMVAIATDPVTSVQTQVPTANPILRYVSPPNPETGSAQFVTSPAEADRVWLPAIKIKRLRREQVRTFPPTAEIEDADAVILLLWCTLAEARLKWEAVAAMGSDELATLASWRPPLSDIIVPYTFRGGIADGMTGPPLDEVGNLSPLLQRRMFYYCLYAQPDQTEYPNGLMLEVSGANEGILLDRQTLDYEVPNDQGAPEVKCRDIPIVQITPVQDTIDNDPMGWPFMSRFAGSTEAMATLYASYLDALDRMLHPHVFIRSTTPVDEVDWMDRSRPIILDPTDPVVTYEQQPAIPDIVAVATDMRQQQDTSSGLTGAAQGLDTPNAVSGIAKQLTVQQAKVSLSGIHQQLMDAFTRGWRICIQMAQAKFTTPQLLQYSGEGGSSEVRWFQGEDLAGVDDIGIEPGTGTMMTAEGKANSLAFLQGQGWLTPDQAADVGVLGVSRDLGLPPDVTGQAIDRAVTAWLKGPDPQWVEQMGQFQQQAQAEQQQIMASTPPGMAPAQSMLQPPPPPMNPFEPRPNDTELPVAIKWVKRLSAVMMSPEYSAMPPVWRQLLDQKYLMCRQAVQPPPDPNAEQGGGEAPKKQGGAGPQQPQLEQAA